MRLTKNSLVIGFLLMLSFSRAIGAGFDVHFVDDYRTGVVQKGLEYWSVAVYVDPHTANEDQLFTCVLTVVDVNGIHYKSEWDNSTDPGDRSARVPAGKSFRIIASERTVPIAYVKAEIYMGYAYMGPIVHTEDKSITNYGQLFQDYNGTWFDEGDSSMPNFYFDIADHQSGFSNNTVRTDYSMVEYNQYNQNGLQDNTGSNVKTINSVGDFQYNMDNNWSGLYSKRENHIYSAILVPGNFEMIARLRNFHQGSGTSIGFFPSSFAGIQIMDSNLPIGNGVSTYLNSLETFGRIGLEKSDGSACGGPHAFLRLVTVGAHSTANGQRAQYDNCIATTFPSILTGASNSDIYFKVRRYDQKLTYFYSTDGNSYIELEVIEAGASDLPNSLYVGLVAQNGRAITGGYTNHIKANYDSVTILPIPE